MPRKPFASVSCPAPYLEVPRGQCAVSSGCRVKAEGRRTPPLRRPRPATHYSEAMTKRALIEEIRRLPIEDQIELLGDVWGRDRRGFRSGAGPGVASARNRAEACRAGARVRCLGRGASPPERRREGLKFLYRSEAVADVTLVCRRSGRGGSAGTTGAREGSAHPCPVVRGDETRLSRVISLACRPSRAGKRRRPPFRSRGPGSGERRGRGAR